MYLLNDLIKLKFNSFNSIDSRPIATSISNRLCSDNNFTETIRYVFQPSDHEGNITCKIGGMLINHEPTSQVTLPNLKFIVSIYSIYNN